MRYFFEEYMLMVSINIEYQYKHFLTREHLVNDGLFYVKEITRCEGI